MKRTTLKKGQPSSKKIWDNLVLRNILNSTISVKYFTVAWPDSETWIWVFLYNFSAQELFQEKKMGQSLFKKHSKFLIFNKVDYGDMAKRGTNNRKFLENIFTQKLI